MTAQNNTLITRPDKLQEFQTALQQTGWGNFWVLTDFDRTLTTAFVDGEKRPSIISVLRDGNYLTPDYAAKAHALFNNYAPQENDSALPRNQREKAMDEWWRTHFALLIKSGLNKKDLEKVVASDKVQLREGVKEFINFLHQRKIPLVIISSSGLGHETITLYLERAGCLKDNIHIISNAFTWGAEGKALTVQEPIIHSLNKTIASAKALPIYKKLQTRRNVLLLGDSLNDGDMIQGFEYNLALKIGFLNEEIEKKLPIYKSKYDALLLNDTSFSFVNELLNSIQLQNR